MTTIKGVLFDLDQTLVDRNQSLQNFLIWQWQECIPLQSIAFNVFQQRFINLDDNGKLWKKEVYDKILKEFFIDSILSRQLEESYLTNFPMHSSLFPNVARILNHFKENELKLGIITNGRSDLQTAVIKNCNLHSIMDTILISETEKIKKPDPCIFELALNRLGLPSQSCVYIGDNPHADIFGAYSIGMRTIWKKNNFFPPPDKSITSAIFENFVELPSIINSFEKIS
ncbi:HAD family hydrolase [Kiloniella majae]|uniref:HAD family hydrolase n=1 Tax=Kiloniella majae TaxID=1938558 RepID=UPI000A27870B|nr:HAD-IA family hydrolase [Kiloniella majae]